MYETGEHPGAGTYECTNCGEFVHLYKDSDPLPPCPRCSNTTYIKIG